jgi:hypothetical protein
MATITEEIPGKKSDTAFNPLTQRDRPYKIAYLSDRICLGPSKNSIIDSSELF